MKLRNGFVNNSSSSSFILNIGKMEEIDFSEIIDWEYTRQDDTPIYNRELYFKDNIDEYVICNH